MASAKTHGISISIPLSNDAWLAGMCVYVVVFASEETDIGDDGVVV